MSDESNSTNVFNGKVVEMFQLASEDEVKRIITKSPNKSCNPDPFEEMCRSVIPLCLNQATICQLLKRYGMDMVAIKYYCPIFNLAFISKHIEKVNAGLF